MGNWRTTDHTADLALEAWGDTSEAALEAALEGMLQLTSDPAAVPPAQSLKLTADGLDWQETLVTAFAEVLYQMQVRGWRFRDVRVARYTPQRVRMVARGQPEAAAAHPLREELKAATYHGLQFAADARGRWHLRVLFDV